MSDEYVFKQAGRHHIKISKSSAETGYDFDVTDPKIRELIITTPPHKLSYEIGDEFDPTGMVVVGKYANGEAVVVEDYVITGFDSSSKVNNQVVTLTKDDGVATLTVDIFTQLYTYEVIDNSTVTLLMYHGKDSIITVPSTREELPVTEIEATCFNHSRVTNVTIPDTVEAIW